MTHASTRNSRLPLLAVGATVATTALLTLGLSAPADAARPVGDSSGRVCIGKDGARVKAGYNGVDPNVLTAAEGRRVERMIAKRTANLSAAKKAAGKARTITIPVHWHVIVKNRGGGGVTNAQIKAQLKVLNDGYAGKTAAKAYDTPFRFVTRSIDRTKNSEWWDWANPDVDPSDDQEAKEALGIKPRTHLNVYIANLGDGLLGYATYPWETDLASGVVILNESLPGGTAAPYNEGDTLTHEAGHWLGLAHTFDNGCNDPGDYVADTPYQFDGDNIFECLESLNTCPQPGKDPVHNFMSYGDDPCLDQFTKGQSKRMSALWPLWRAPNY